MNNSSQVARDLHTGGRGSGGPVQVLLFPCCLFVFERSVRLEEIFGVGALLRVPINRICFRNLFAVNHFALMDRGSPYLSFYTPYKDSRKAQ